MTELEKQLLEALKLARNSLVAFKFVPGQSNTWEAHDEDHLRTVNSAIAAAKAAQAATVKDSLIVQQAPAITAEQIVELLAQEWDKEDPDDTIDIGDVSVNIRKAGARLLAEAKDRSHGD
ncbi:hypothetical protein [Chromobacterium haemolyticum]|uniref:hypothetical protein n=1 Tax=Chromobacterium TaxID=535 RepID=UPI00405706CE